jgi:hypothetical protein
VEEFQGLNEPVETKKSKRLTAMEKDSSSKDQDQDQEVWGFSE